MLNQVVLMGRLTRNPELKFTANSKPYTKFSIAINRNTKDGQTDFPTCVAYGKTAEFICNWFEKGSMIIVLGRLQTSSWEDKNGKKQFSMDVKCDSVQFGESKKSSSPQNTQTYPQAQNSYTVPPFIPTNDSDFAELGEDDGDVPF